MVFSERFPCYRSIVLNASSYNFFKSFDKVVGKLQTILDLVVTHLTLSDKGICVSTYFLNLNVMTYMSTYKQ